MASDKFQKLVVIGPFKNYDATTADEYLDPNDASYGSVNCDSVRQPGALVPYRGRSNVIPSSTFSTTNAQFGGIYGWNPTADLQALVTWVGAPVNALFVTGVNGWTFFYSSAGVMTNFTQAFQYGSVLYLNNGWQLKYNPAAGGSVNAYVWQQAPTAYLVGSTVTMTNVSGGGYTPALAGLYYYTFTRVYTYADGSMQETTPDSNLTLGGNYGTATLDTYGQEVIIYPLDHLITAASSTCAQITLSGTGNTFWGTALDGSTWTTNIYRSSFAQPQWYLIQNMYPGVTGIGLTSTRWVDNANTVPGGNTDAQIAKNVQLDLNRDAPPFYTGGATGAIFTHANRGWLLMNVNDAATLNLPSLQLWYSDYGLPWSYNQVSGADLAGDTGAVLPPAGTMPSLPYGERPIAGVSMSSVAVLLFSKSFWLLYGNDPTTFVPTKAFDIGCIAPGSVVNVQGTLYWLNDQGVYSFNGSIPNYISEKIRNYLGNIPIADWADAFAWFSHQTYWLSFPATGTTIGFYIPTQTWRVPLQYAASGGWSSPADRSPNKDASGNSTGTHFNAAYLARANTLNVDIWFSTEGDLGGPMNCNWQSGSTDSEVPWAEKTYQWIYINAPVKSGIVYVNLQIQGINGSSNNVNASFDLSKGPVQFYAIEQSMQRGTVAQLNCNLSTAWESATPTYVYEVGVMGEISTRPFIQVS